MVRKHNEDGNLEGGKTVKDIAWHSTGHNVHRKTNWRKLEEDVLLHHRTQL